MWREFCLLAPCDRATGASKQLAPSLCGTALAPSGQRLKVVDSDVVVGVDGEVIALLVRNNHAVDVLARGADERGDVALSQADAKVNAAVGLRPAILLGESDQLARDAAFDRLSGERFDLFVGVT